VEVPAFDSTCEMVGCHVFAAKTCTRSNSFAWKILPSIDNVTLHTKIFQCFFVWRTCVRTPPRVNAVAWLVANKNMHTFIPMLFSFEHNSLRAFTPSHKRNAIVKPPSAQIIIRHRPCCGFRFPSNGLQHNLFWWEGRWLLVPSVVYKAKIKRFIWSNTLQTHLSVWHVFQNWCCTHFPPNTYSPIVLAGTFSNAFLEKPYNNVEMHISWWW